MPSLRGRILRLSMKYVTGPMFARAGTSVDALRKTDAYLLRFQKLPRGTEVQQASVGDVAAEWVAAPGADQKCAFLHLHGGAFVTGSPATHRELAARISAASGAVALVLDYRLAPEHPFPAALEDAVGAYQWLVGQGYAPQHLAIGGDSAGGCLALQTVLALRDRGEALPAAAYFLSPVTDVVRVDGESYTTNAGIDPIVKKETSRAVMSNYVGGNDPQTPLLYPAGMDLAGLPPLCIHVGDYEALLSDSVRLAERARNAGVEVEFRIWPGMWHVFQMAARLLPEGRRSIDEIGAFVAEQLR